MLEIDKLRQRLKNIKKGVTEYRMTVAEAQALVKEFDAKAQEKPHMEAALNEPTVITRTIDGGAF